MHFVLHCASKSVKGVKSYWLHFSLCSIHLYEIVKITSKELLKGKSVLHIVDVLFLVLYFLSICA